MSLRDGAIEWPKVKKTAERNDDYAATMSKMAHKRIIAQTYERLIMLEHKVNCDRVDKVKIGRTRPKSSCILTICTHVLHTGIGRQMNADTLMPKMHSMLMLMGRVHCQRNGRKSTAVCSKCNSSTTHD